MNDEPVILDAHQRMTLQHYLKSAMKDPPEHRLEALQMAFKVHHGLYQQEGDAEGAAIYKPLLDAAMKAKSVEELEALLQAKQEDAPKLPHRPKDFGEFKKWLVASRRRRQQKIEERKKYQEGQQQDRLKLKSSLPLPDQLKKPKT